MSTEVVPVVIVENKALMAQLAQKWISRRQAQGLKPGTVTHAKAQLEFFMGAVAAAQCIGHPVNEAVLLLLAVGRDATELLPK